MSNIVYILMGHVDFEGDDILGAYSTKKKAEIAEQAEKDSNSSYGYDEFSINKYEIDVGYIEEADKYREAIK